MADDDIPADVDPSEFAPDAELTELDTAQFVAAIEDAAAPTSIVDGVTAPHPLARSAEFKAGLEVGRAEGERAARAQAEADAVTEHRKVREDAIDAFRSLWIIFELGPNGPPAQAWEEAQRWARSRMTPL